MPLVGPEKIVLAVRLWFATLCAQLVYDRLTAFHMTNVWQVDGNKHSFVLLAAMLIFLG